MTTDSNKIVNSSAVNIKHTELSRIMELLDNFEKKSLGKLRFDSMKELSSILVSIFLREIPQEDFERRLIEHIIIDYCINLKEYFFIGNKFYDKTEYKLKLESKEIVLIEGDVSFSSMLKIAIDNAIEYRDSNEEFNKVEFIRIIYTSLQDYKIFNVDKKLWKELSHYKLTVICGLIAFKLKHDCYPSFKEIFIDKNLPPTVIKGIVVADTNKFVKSYLKKK